MSDLTQAVTGVALDAPSKAAADVQAVVNVLAEQQAAAQSGSTSFLDKTKSLFGSATSSAQSAAARVSSTASQNAGLMWIILAAMVAAGFFLFAGGKGKKSIFSLGRGRKPRGGSFR